MRNLDSFGQNVEYQPGASPLHLDQSLRGIRYTDSHFVTSCRQQQQQPALHKLRQSKLPGMDPLRRLLSVSEASKLKVNTYSLVSNEN